MIYLFFGDQADDKRKASQKIFSSLGFESNIVISDLDVSLEQLYSLSGNNSLFDSKTAVALVGVLENKEALKYVMEHLVDFQKSPNVFVFLEKKLFKTELDKFKKYAEEVKEFKLIDSKKAKINPFAITLPLERRDKKNTWLSFQKIRKSDIEMEALAGMIFWKIKSMILSGQNKKFSESELKELSSKIITLYHDSHRGLVDMETGLEKMILESL